MASAASGDTGRVQPAAQILVWAPALERDDRAMHWYTAVNWDRYTPEQIDMLIDRVLEAERDVFNRSLPEGCTWNPDTGAITGPLSSATALTAALEAAGADWKDYPGDPEWPEPADERVLSDALRAAFTQVRHRVDELERELLGPVVEDVRSDENRHDMPPFAEPDDRHGA